MSNLLAAKRVTRTDVVRYLAVKFISPSSFWTPDYVVESAWFEHAPFAFWLIEAGRPRVVVELGAHRGFSYCCFCQAIERLGLNAKAYAIGSWEGDGHADFYGEDIFQELSAHHERYASFSRLVRSTFGEALLHLEDGSVDLLHIDGLHSGEDIKQQFESWQPKLSSRGVVLLHGTHDRQGGASQLWSRIKREYPSFEFLHGHGLGVIGAGPEQSDELLEFFALSSDGASARTVRDAYARLGDHVTALHSNEALAEMAEDERQQLLLERSGREQQRASENSSRKDETSDHHARLEAAYAELRLARRRPLTNLRRYMRWKTARYILKLNWVLPRSAIKWASRRLEKNLPDRRDADSRTGETPRTKKNWPFIIKALDTLARQKWLFSERRIYKFEKSLEKRRQLLAAAQPTPGQSGVFGQTPVPDALSEKLFQPLFSAATDKGVEYLPYSKNQKVKSRIKAIAFYLPQFHPIPENDEWWGEGFTEWTNVSKAVPQFRGHYQPRLPDALGYYDLRLPIIMELQVALAKNYGIYGFCFYHYWFSGGKRLLDLPLNDYINNKNINFPFCICWANENWTRRWDGNEQDILIEQKYTIHDDLQFIEDLAAYLTDSRYIRVNGRPLIIVYRVNLLHDPKRTVETWRSYCKEKGIGDPYLVAAQSFDILDPRPYGFDAAVEFPPHGCGATMPQVQQLDLINTDFDGIVYDYADTTKLWQTASIRPDYTLFKTVMPSWDNQARRPGGGHAFFGSSPFLYRWWLRNACEITDNYQSDSEKFIFINAWNEWAEGAYLEPDRRFGYAYLEATKAATSEFSGGSLTPVKLPKASCPGTAVICHLYHQDRWPEILTYLHKFPHEFDLYITITADLENTVAHSISMNFDNAKIIRLPNRGRDIGPFLEVLREIRQLPYRSICKIHSKKSPHRIDGDKWFFGLMNELLGSRDAIRAITSEFANNPRLGMVGPAQHLLRFTAFTTGMERYETVFEKRYGLNCRKADSSFFAGSMFWFRPEALVQLATDFYQADFEREMGQLDRSLAHFVERAFLPFCEMEGFQVFTNEQIEERTKSGRVLVKSSEYEFARSQKR